MMHSMIFASLLLGCAEPDLNAEKSTLRSEKKAAMILSNTRKGSHVEL
jgi:hypothetical protein